MKVDTSFVHRTNHTRYKRSITFKNVQFLGVAFFPLFIYFCASLVLASGYDNLSQATIRLQVYAYSISLFIYILKYYKEKQYFKDLGWAILLLGHIAWFMVPALYQALMPNIWFGDWIKMDVPDFALRKACSLISLFLLANAFGYQVTKSESKGRRLILPKLLLIRKKHRVFLVVILFLMGLLPYIIFGGGISEIIMGILGGRSEKLWVPSAEIVAFEANNQRTFFWLTRAFLVSGGALGGSYAVAGIITNTFQKILFSIIFCFSSFIIYFDQGTRSILAMTVFPVLVIYILVQSKTLSGFDSTRIIYTSIAGIFLLLVLTQFQLQYRSESRRENIAALSFIDIISPRQQNDFFTETANAVVVRDNILGKNLGESPLLFFLVNPIPRALWSEKPLSQAMWNYTLYRWEGRDIWYTGGNALPSVVGQYYINWHVIGVIWAGLLYGILAALLGMLPTGKREFLEYLVLAILGMTFLFVSFRFLSPGFHYPILALSLTLYSYRKFFPPIFNI